LSLYSYLRLRQLRSSMGLRQITNTPAAVHRRARSDDEELADLQRAIESAESDLARKRKQIERKLDEARKAEELGWSLSAKPLDNGWFSKQLLDSCCRGNLCLCWPERLGELGVEYWTGLQDQVPIHRAREQRRKHQRCTAQNS
jgi:hypothetical protein